MSEDRRVQRALWFGLSTILVMVGIVMYVGMAGM